MRNWLFAVSVLVIVHPAAAQPYGMAQEGTYRLGGTYLWVDAGAATSCAMRCEADTRCQAWSYADILGHSPACELKGSPGRLIARPDMVSGLSPRTLREGARRVVPAVEPSTSPAVQTHARPARPAARNTSYQPVSRGVSVPELSGQGQGESSARSEYYPEQSKGQPEGPSGYYPGVERVSNAASSANADIPQARARIVGSGSETSKSEYYPNSGDRRPAATRPPRTFPDE